MGQAGSKAKANVVSAVGKLRISPSTFGEDATPDEKLHLALAAAALGVSVAILLATVTHGRRGSGGGSNDGAPNTASGSDSLPEKNAVAPETCSTAPPPSASTSISTSTASSSSTVNASTVNASAGYAADVSANPLGDAVVVAVNDDVERRLRRDESHLRESRQGSGQVLGKVTADSTTMSSSGSAAAASPGGTAGDFGSYSGTTTSSATDGDSSDDNDKSDDDGGAPEENEPLDLKDALRLISELLDALSHHHDPSMVETYGSFVSCLISMQKVFQRYDWGYAEWPDVVAVLDAHAGNPQYDAQWAVLQSELTRLGFPRIPIFKGDLTREALLAIMRDMLVASKQVADSVAALKRTGDSVIDAHHAFVEENTVENYIAWRDQCSPEEFRAVEECASEPFTVAGGSGAPMVEVPRDKLKEWKDGYLVRAMLNMMAPLTTLQEKNMKEYGIGATHFQQQVWRWGDDPEVARVKGELEHMMTLIHPTASETEETSANSNTDDYGSDEFNSEDEESRV